MTKALLEWETIDAHQIDDIMNGRPPRPPKPVAAKPRRRPPTAAATAARSPIPRRRRAPERVSAAAGPEGVAAATPFAFRASRPLVMGIVNVTADSFSDGGRFLDPAQAIEHGAAAARRGRGHRRRRRRVDAPGRRSRCRLDEELARVLPVVEALVREGVAVSVDTMKPEVMRAAIAAGAR